MLTAAQHRALVLIHSEVSQFGVTPSFEEMKVRLGLKSKSGVHRLVHALEERGFIRLIPNRYRAIEVLRPPVDGNPLSAFSTEQLEAELQRRRG